MLACCRLKADANHSRRYFHRLIHADRYNYIRGSDGSRRLYHVAADPEESEDVADENPEVVSRLEGWTSGWTPSGTPSTPATPRCARRPESGWRTWATYSDAAGGVLVVFGPLGCELTGRQAVVPTAVEHIFTPLDI